MTLGNAAYLYCLAGFLAFTVGYGVLNRWWRTETGTNVFLFMAGCSVTMGLRLGWLIDASWFLAHRDALWAWCFSIVGTVVWWRFSIWLRSRKRPAAERESVKL